MSLLDAGMHADHPGVIIDSDAMFGENMFGYSALRGRGAMRSRVGTFALDIQSMQQIFFIYLFFVAPYVAAHKHKQLTAKNRSKLHLKYKNVNTNLRAPSSHPTRNRPTAAGPGRGTDTPRPHQECSMAWLVSSWC